MKGGCPPPWWKSGLATLLGAVCPQRQQVAADGAGALLPVGSGPGAGRGLCWGACTARGTHRTGFCSAWARILLGSPPYLRASSSLLSPTAPAVC